MDSMIETVMIMLAIGVGTILGVIVFLKVLFRELEELDYSMDYNLERYEYDEE
jgi:hypothetical protein